MIKRSGQTLDTEEGDRVRRNQADWSGEGEDARVTSRAGWATGWMDMPSPEAWNMENHTAFRRK